MQRIAVMTFGLLIASSATAALAQSGAALLLKPWAEDGRMEASADAMVFDSADADPDGPGAEDQLNMQWYEGVARTRFSQQRGAPAVGIEASHLELNGGGRLGLPERLMDYSLGFGVGIGEWQGWELGFTAGFGVAGDQWHDSDAWYGMANLIFLREIDDNRSWQFLINYNGNRTFLPDVPLPGVAYHHRVTDTFSYTAGLPYSSIAWQFLPAVTLDVGYVFPYTVDASVTWEVADGVALFGAFHNRFNRYRWERQDDDRNRPDRYLLFRQRRLETGVDWQPCDEFSLTLAGGFAFDQEFETGWDSRDTDQVADVDDAPYLRLGGELRF